VNKNLINGADFALHGHSLEGSVEVAQLVRLASETVDGKGVIHWTLRGHLNRYKHAVLELSIRGEVNLVCQRCLQPVAFGVDNTPTIVVAASESEADEIEALLDDPDVDVIASEEDIDVLLLVEDEVLLGLPLAPKHEQCIPVEDAADVRSDSPFAVLKKSLSS
jgi:uncharacterized protein